MENIFCKHLNLDFDINLSIIDQFKNNVIDRHKTFRIAIVDNNLQNFLKPLNVVTRSPACFYTPPRADRGNHHIDSNQFDNMVKLNYVVNGQNTVMQWFKFNGSEEHIIRNKNKVGGGYLAFKPEGCELIWEEELKSPCLVNAGIPHNVMNRSDRGRWSVSYALFDLNTVNLQWDQTNTIFKNYF